MSINMTHLAAFTDPKNGQTFIRTQETPGQLGRGRRGLRDTIPAGEAAVPLPPMAGRPLRRAGPISSLQLAGNLTLNRIGPQPP